VGGVGDGFKDFGEVRGSSDRIQFIATNEFFGESDGVDTTNPGFVEFVDGGVRRLRRWLRSSAEYCRERPALHPDSAGAVAVCRLRQAAHLWGDDWIFEGWWPWYFGPHEREVNCCAAVSGGRQDCDERVRGGQCLTLRISRCGTNAA